MVEPSKIKLGEKDEEFKAYKQISFGIQGITDHHQIKFDFSMPIGNESNDLEAVSKSFSAFDLGDSAEEDVERISAPISSVPLESSSTVPINSSSVVGAVEAGDKSDSFQSKASEIPDSTQKNVRDPGTPTTTKAMKYDDNDGVAVVMSPKIAKNPVITILSVKSIEKAARHAKEVGKFLNQNPGKFVIIIWEVTQLAAENCLSAAAVAAVPNLIDGIEMSIRRGIHIILNNFGFEEMNSHSTMCVPIAILRHIFHLDETVRSHIVVDIFIVAIRAIVDLGINSSYIYGTTDFYRACHWLNFVFGEDRNVPLSPRAGSTPFALLLSDRRFWLN
jgi:hypothetical protein